MSPPQAPAPPSPVHPPTPLEGTPNDPINVPPPTPDAILPGGEEQPGIPDFPGPDSAPAGAEHIGQPAPVKGRSVTHEPNRANGLFGKGCDRWVGVNRRVN
jgi:hypothetical protein